MKIRLFANRGPGAYFHRLMIAVSPMAVATSVIGADTPFTNISYLYDVPVPGILVTNVLGQGHLKGNVHVLAVQGSDRRVTGSMQTSMDLGYQPDGTGLFGGTAYFEVGTWENQTNFSPTGELWVMNYRGVAQTNNSDQITMTGYGIGGNIEGLRIEVIASRGPGAVFDPAIPYLASGVIKPPPVTLTNTIRLIGAPTWAQDLGPQGRLTITNGQMVMHAAWPGVRTRNIADTIAWVSPAWPASVSPGHTLETRVDLVRLDGPGANAALALYYTDGVGYWLAKGRDGISLGKQTVNGMTYLTCEKVVTGNSNRVLTLSATPSGRNLILTARVLNRDKNESAEYVKTYTDTPGSDPSVTAAQVQQITGMSLIGLVNDPVGSPWTTFKSPWLGLFQYTDGTLPAVEVVFANFAMRTYDIPPVSISRAVHLTVPCPEGMSFCLESAQALEGPWLPINQQSAPGVQTFTIPAAQGAEFFRSQLAP